MNAPPPEPLQLALRAAAGEFDPDVRRWLAEALRAFLARPGGTLESELGLARGRGEPTVRLELRRAERDRWLREAWRLVTPDDAVTGWRRTVRLADEIERFATRGLWTRWRELDAPPADASALRAALWRAFRVGLSVPASPSQLHRLLASGPCSDASAACDAMDPSEPDGVDCVRPDQEGAPGRADDAPQADGAARDAAA